MENLLLSHYAVNLYIEIVGEDTGMSNYYLALGIDSDADLNKIKKAYRSYCKKYHPDTARESQRQNFLRVQEAYDILSDEEKRKEYDRSIEHQGRQVPVEFMKPEFWEEQAYRKNRFREFSSVIDDFFSGFVPGFFEEDFSGRKNLFIELVLSPEEARRGGNFPIELPVLEACPVCSGRGHNEYFICSVCSGSGKKPGKRSFSLHVPPGVYSGLEARISLEGIGLKDVSLNIDIVVL